MHPQNHEEPEMPVIFTPLSTAAVADFLEKCLLDPELTSAERDQMMEERLNKKELFDIQGILSEFRKTNHRYYLAGVLDTLLELGIITEDSYNELRYPYCF